ncbi:hypothetical protein [Thermoflavimicrobium daqui]|jgi:hypothetical protein|uniref:Uncharacterized protein n=1 Tax=Thermoflavimicrobium daqui TaxID=2137476 RepID=A0A364K639_9BACL|nr:hypothetical protein [Thermoflavimicrobium daqui]RAL25766.1 hypothetical protein DL897_06735 [Thermoflavimicrobium daqui]
MNRKTTTLMVLLASAAAVVLPFIRSKRMNFFRRWGRFLTKRFKWNSAYGKMATSFLAKQMIRRLRFVK